MRISIVDLSDSDEEPIVVLPAVRAAPAAVGDESDLLDQPHSLHASPTARKNRSAYARTAELLAGRLSANVALGDDDDDDEVPGPGSAGWGGANRRQGQSGSLSPTKSVTAPPLVARGGSQPPYSRARTASVEPSRPVKRDYTPYWSSVPSTSKILVGDEAPHLDVLSSSPGSANGEDGMDFLSGDEAEDSDDSEEENWPVNPRGYWSGSSAHRRRRSQSRSQDDEEVLRRIRLSALPDFEKLAPAGDSVWAAATGRYYSQARALSHSRNVLPASAASTASFGLRKAPQGTPKQRTPFGLSVVSEEASRQPSAAVDEVQKILRDLNMRRDQDEQRLQSDFEARSKQLWDSIEASIREAEEKNEAEAAQKTAVLIAKRKEQEANERRAREAREAEERRIAEEKERAQKEAERAQKEAEEARRKLEEAKKKREAAAEEERRREAAAADTLGGTAGPVLWTQAQSDYVKWYGRIQEIKSTVLPQVSSNSEWRKQCFTAKRQITPKIGQLTNSQNEIVRITLSIGDVLSQAKGADSAIYVWILNHLSKCLIRQAEQEVAARLSTAFPLARVIVWLILSGHPELGDVLMARLVKKCCYVVGYFPSKGQNQSDAELRKQLGRPSPDETTHAFNSRMSGIFALYCAVLQTVPSPPPSGGGQMELKLELMPAHFRPERLWIWQARALSKPMNEHPLTPTLLATCFEVAGSRSLAYFGRQMNKLWRSLLVDGLRNRQAGFVSRFVGPGVDPTAEDGGAKAASARLQLLLEEWEKTGVVKANPAADLMDE